ncbi:MAG TPA: thioesterase [Bellilinea sp.]|nr:thioesterase [Bellilinea sp.]
MTVGPLDLPAQEQWEERFRVPVYETDIHQQIKVSSFFRLMELGAQHHADNLRVSNEDMLRLGQSWVLSRTKLILHRLPRSEEWITWRTWPKGFSQKIFFARDFEFLDDEGEILAQATSSWIIFDLKSRRMVPSTAMKLDFPVNTARHAIAEDLQKIAAPVTMEPVYQLQARFSSLDELHHVNNARYVDWALDAFPYEFHRENMPASLQINFLNEVRPEERLELLKGQTTDGGWVICGERLPGREKAFEVSVSWKPR